MGLGVPYRHIAIVTVRHRIADLVCAGPGVEAWREQFGGGMRVIPAPTNWVVALCPDHSPDLPTLGADDPHRVALSVLQSCLLCSRNARLQLGVSLAGTRFPK